MKVRLILLGTVAGLVLPLAAANGRAIFDSGLYQAGAGADLGRGAAPIAGNFGRSEDEDKGNQGDNDHKGDFYDPGNFYHPGDFDHRCRFGDGFGDKDHHDVCCDFDRDNDHKCEKSPSKPYRP
jgi:hypothetical protein